MALVVVLSVFNGIDSLVKSIFSSFDPDLKITPVTGKTFDPDTLKTTLKNLSGIAYWAEVLEENAILEYDKRQDIATVKGRF